MPTLTQHYNLRGFTADERENILKRLWHYHIVGDESSYLGSEGTVVITNLPSETVMSTIRSTLEETISMPVRMALIDGRAVYPQTVPPVHTYDLFSFTADELNRILLKLEGKRFQLDSPTFVFDAYAYTLTTDLSLGYVFSVLRSAVLESYAENRKVARDPLTDDEATMPREALFRITITEEQEQYERLVFAANPDEAVAALSLVGPVHVKVERVPYRVTTEDQVRGKH